MPAHSFTLAPNLCICRDPNCDVPLGYCHCGCGIRTAVARQSSTKRGHVNGMPKMWISGHSQAHKRIDFNDAKPFKIDGVYCKLIGLTFGMYAVVCERDHKWLTRWRWQAAWSSADECFYAIRTHREKWKKQETIRMHRFILGLTRKDLRVVDHENGNTLDNRRRIRGRGNLRIVTHRQSKLNCGVRKDCVSGFKGVGVDKHTGRFRARITIHGKLTSLGHFETPEAAHRAYCKASRVYHGEYGRTE